MLEEDIKNMEQFKNKQMFIGLFDKLRDIFSSKKKNSLSQAEILQNLKDTDRG